MRIILQKVSFLFSFLFFSQLSFAQTVSDTATYVDGIQSTVFDNNATIADNAFGCMDTLKMSIGTGRYITSVDVFYSIIAPFSGNGWISEQRSFVEYLNTNTTEGAVSIGDQGWDSSGTETYSRQGLTLANGSAGAGDLEFFLHTFRSFGFNLNCSPAVQFLPDSSFIVVVNHIALPTCTEPTNLAVGIISNTSIELNWTTGGATNWQVEYGAVGFAPGTGTLVNANSNPFTISGLTDGTAYDFRVRDSCAVSDVSFWSTTTSAYTLCNAYAAPFLENFENTSWTTGNGNFGRGTIDTCWIRNYTSDFVFKSAPKNFVSNTTGPAVDHTSGTATGKFMLSERLVNSGAPYTATIQTPAIEMSALTVPQLSFWYYMYGANIGTLSAEVSNDGGSTFTSVWTLSGEQQNNRNAPWLEATVDLSAYATDTIIVQFTVLQSLEGGLGDVSLDDVEIRETPTCLDPTNFVVDFSWINKAQLSWTSGGATDWELEYGTPGFAIGSGTRVASNSNPAQINSLLSSTTYDVYVRDSCGVNDISNWVGPISFTTYCNSVIATPYTKDFEGTNWTTGANNADLGTIEMCWFRSPLTPYAWKTGPTITVNPNSGTRSDHTNGTGQFVYAERLVNFANDTIEAELITPPINLGTLTAPQLTFWYHMFGNSVVNLNVEINAGNGWTSVYTKTGQQQASTTAPWKEAVVNLNAYLNDTVMFRFTTINNNGGTNNDVSIDDFFVGNAPSCQTPADLSVLGTTQNSIVFQWTNLGSAAFQNIEYGAPGFSLGSGNYISSTGNPATVSGLTASTTYEFYLRDSCAVGDVSAWLGPISATTDCAPLIAPLIENFDGATWTVGTNQIPGVLDPCWRRDLDSAFVFTVGQNGTPSVNTGPTLDNTSGTGKFLYTETYFGFAFSPNVTILSTPLVDVSGLINPELKFYYHAFGADINTMNVRVFDGTNSTIVHTISGAQQTTNAAAWNEVIVDLIAFAGDTIKVQFEVTKAVGVSFNADFALDNISIAEQPACPKPSNLSVNNATANSVDLAWTSGGAADWQIEYGTTGFIQGNGTIAAANANPFTLTGLNPSTTYDFYLRDSCGVGSTSDWIGPITLNTLCTPVLAPFTENFDGPNFNPGAAGFGVAGAIDPCWNRNPIATYFWKTGPSTPQTAGTGSSIGDHTSGNGGYIFTEAGGFVAPPLFAEITTPQIDLTPLTNPELTYWYHMFGNNVNELYVEVSTNNGVSYVGMDTLSSNQQNAQNDPWLEASVNLLAFVNQTVIIKFTAEKTSNGNQSDISIDDVSIDEAPTCPKPSALAITGVTASSATLTWTTGGATNWQVAYGLTGYDPNGGISTGTLVNATTNPFTVTGLSAQTEYCFYVRDSCAVGDVSDWTLVSCGLTDCGLLTAPYTENFDGSEWVGGTGLANAGSIISNCWTVPNPANPNFSTGTGATTSGGTGPTGDATTGNGNYIYTEASQGALGAGEITSPLIYIPATITNPRVGFNYHLFGPNIDSLEVLVEQNGTRTKLGSFVGQQQITNADAWLQNYYNLNAYSGDTIKIVFIGTNQGFNGDISIDDFSIDAAPSCPEPSLLAATATTTNSITLSWTTGGATNWQIEYGAPGFAIGTGTLVNITTNPFTVAGLAAQTTYEFYVRDSCSATDISLWSFVSATANTSCGLVTAPYTENFDGNAWVTGTGLANTGSIISSCWTVPATANPNFSTGTGPTTSGGTGPAADATTGNGNYIYTEASGGLGTGEITSPLIYIPATIINPRVGFNYHMFGANIDSLEVLVEQNGTRTKLGSFVGQQQAANADAWLQNYYDLTAYAGDTISIVFIGTNQGFNGDISIDDFSIDAAPSCPEPSLLAVTSTTTNSVTLSWTTGGATNWQIEYGAPGFVNGTGTIVNAALNPFTITGLTTQTTYDFYVRDSCGANDVSIWSLTSVNATTDCATFTAPFAENFDGSTWVTGTGLANTGSLISSCWTVPTAANPNFSTGTGATTSGGTGPTGDATTGNGNYIYTEASQGGLGAGEITSPLIYIPATITNPRVGFQYHMFGANIDSLEVLLENNDVRTKLGSITGAQQTANTSAWLQQYFDAGNVTGDTIRIIFIGTNNGFNGDIAIDDVVLDNTPNCPAPSNLIITAINSNSATLSWTSGGATNWQIEYGTPGFISGSGTIVAATTNPFTVTGLNPQTGYEFYVRDSCGAASTSTWSVSPVSDTTDCGVFLAPFNESFDGPAFISGGSVFNPGSIDDCWDRITGNYFWAAEQGATASANTGPSADHTTGIGKFMFTDGFGGAQNTPLTTPFISLVPLSNPQLRFWYHMYGATINRMEVEIWDGAAWIQAWSLSGQQQTASTDAWQEAVVSLSAYAGDTVQLRFIGYRNAGGTASDMALDDVQIVDSTGCATPSNLSLVTATTSSLQISWTSLSTIGSIVKYRAVGSTAPFNFTSALSGIATLTGLQSGTTYQVLVRDSCGSDVSLYTNSSLFSTLCGAVNAPYLETFDGAGWTVGTGNTNIGDLINACWTRDNDTATRWTTGSGGTPSNQTGPFGDFNGGGNFLYTEASIGTGTSDVISPSIFLPTFLAQPTLEFYYHMFGQNITSLSVEIDNGSGFTSLRTITGQQQPNNFAAWLSDTLNLSAYSGDTIRIKFVGINTGFTGDISIDNVSITGGTGPCAAPSNIAFSNISSTSADVSWTSNSGLSDVEVVIQGAAQGTGVVYPSVASPFVITSLTAGTAYDVYIRDACGTTKSTWTNSTVTTTGCLALTTSVTITNITATGFDVNWTSLSGVSDVQVIPTGGALGSGFVFNSVTSPYAVTGLAVNTTYDVYVRDRCGIDSTAWINITSSTLSCAPVVISNMAFSRLGLFANFSATVAGQDSLTWDFGNGNTSTVQNPTEVYAAAGTYTVILSAFNACGNSDFDTLTIDVCDSIIPDFTFTNNSDSVFFDASATTSANAFYWDFGNGNTGTGIQPKTPLINGTMTITLIADNACGDSVVFTQTIQVCQQPLASWTYNIISTSSSGMLVQFDATASQNASTYDWNFGDGNTANGTAVPQHNYLVPSLNYTVTMIASNACGNSSTSSYKLNQIGQAENVFTSNYSIFPNPATDFVTIAFENATTKPTQIELYDLQGKLLSIHAVDALADAINIDIQNVARGTYLVKVIDEKGISVTRLTKY